MIEYTWNDIIINPNNKRAGSIIGKECYFDNNPGNVLGRANYDDTVNILPLKEIEPNSAYPFIFDGVEGPVAFSCIIVKKEIVSSEIKTVPFKNIDEFLGHYGSSLMQPKETLDYFYRFLDGMWIRNKYTKSLCQVIYIGASGVCVGSLEYGIDWYNLHRDFEFLDGTSCGKLVEDNNG